MRYLPQIGGVMVSHHNMMSPQNGDTRGGPPPFSDATDKVHWHRLENTYTETRKTINSLVNGAIVTEAINSGSILGTVKLTTLKI